MDFLLSPEYWQALLSPQAQASLTEKLIIVAVVWMTMGRKVSARFKTLESSTKMSIEDAMTMFQAHLTKIESKFDAAIAEMKAMRDAMAKDLSVNTQRLNSIETRVERLETK